jgi:hypothetical protein
MAEIINLRHARKTRARNEKAEKASEKRRVHGRSKAERLSEERERKRRAQELDGKKLD